MTNNITKLAVWDFDGTLIPVQSGVKLSWFLFKSGKMPVRSGLRLCFWAIRYKLHLPYDEDIAREIIFRTFEGKSVKQSDRFIDEFYQREIEPLVRNDLIKIAEGLSEQGYVNVILSAAFYPMLNSFAKDKSFNHLVATEMEIDHDGCYTGNVDGKPCAKKEKIARLEKFADKTFGTGNWEISYAYADHYTDKPLLKLADNPVAVDPDDTLKLYAKRHKWQIIDFNKSKE